MSCSRGNEKQLLRKEPHRLARFRRYVTRLIDDKEITWGPTLIRRLQVDQGATNSEARATLRYMLVHEEIRPK